MLSYAYNIPLIESLVGGNCHFDFITNSEEKESTFWLVKSYLTDNFVKALGEKLLSDWADSTLTSLALHELLIEHLSKTGNINSRCWLMAHILDVMFS